MQARTSLEEALVAAIKRNQEKEALELITQLILEASYSLWYINTPARECTLSFAMKHNMEKVALALLANQEKEPQHLLRKMGEVFQAAAFHHQNQVLKRLILFADKQAKNALDARSYLIIDRDEYTVLHAGAYNLNIKGMELLLPIILQTPHGVSFINHLTKDGNSILHLLLIRLNQRVPNAGLLRWKPGAYKMIYELIQAGADFFVHNHENKMPCDLFLNIPLTAFVRIEKSEQSYFLLILRYLLLCKPMQSQTRKFFMECCEHLGVGSFVEGKAFVDFITFVTISPNYFVTLSLDEQKIFLNTLRKEALIHRPEQAAFKNIALQYAGIKQLRTLCLFKYNFGSNTAKDMRNVLPADIVAEMVTMNSEPDAKKDRVTIIELLEAVNQNLEMYATKTPKNAMSLVCLYATVCILAVILAILSMISLYRFSEGINYVVSSVLLCLMYVFSMHYVFQHPSTEAKLKSVKHTELNRELKELIFITLMGLPKDNALIPAENYQDLVENVLRLDRPQYLRDKINIFRSIKGNLERILDSLLNTNLSFCHFTGKKDQDYIPLQPEALLKPRKTACVLL